MEATRVLGSGSRRRRGRSGLGAIKETDSGSGGSGGGTSDTDTTDTTTTSTTTSTEIDEPILYEPDDDTSTSPLPSDYIETLTQRENRLRELESSYSGKWFWSEFSDRVQSMISQLEAARDEAVSTRSITRPGLPDQALSLIREIEDRADDPAPLPDLVKQHIATLKDLRSRLRDLRNTLSDAPWWPGIATEVERRLSAIDQAISDSQSKRTRSNPDLPDAVRDTIAKINSIKGVSLTNIPVAAWGGRLLGDNVVDYLNNVDETISSLDRVSSKYGGTSWWNTFADEVDSFRNELMNAGRDALSTAGVTNTGVVSSARALIDEIIHRGTIPDSVLEFVDNAEALLARIRDLKQKHQGKGWWSEVEGQTSDIISRLKTAPDASMKQGEVTDTTLVSEAQALIRKITSLRDSAQSETAQTTDTVQTTDTTDTVETTSTETESTSDDDTTSTTTSSGGGGGGLAPRVVSDSQGGGGGSDEAVQDTAATTKAQQAGMGDSTPLVIAGGIVAAGLLLYSNS